MAKKKKVTITSRWEKTPTKNKWLYITGASVVLIVGSYFLFQSVKLNEDKREFNKIESVFSELDFNGSKQDSVKKSCYELSEKFSKGSTYCKVSIKSSFLSIDSESFKIELPPVFKEKTNLNRNTELNQVKGYTYTDSDINCTYILSKVKSEVSFECGKTVWRPIYPMKED